MDCRLELLVHVIAHLVTTDAKRLRIRDFQCGIEATPKDNARYKAADGEKSQAVMLARSDLAPRVASDLKLGSVSN